MPSPTRLPPGCFAPHGRRGRWSKLPVSEVQRLIHPVSFYRNKAVHVRQTCEQLLTRYAGRVPRTMEELLTLPGVGRKTANLVLILAHRSAENICVDTHVHRISNRLGWVATRTPDETERALYAVVHRRWWPVINLYLVTWGQNVCRPVYPLCGSCVRSCLCVKGRLRREDSESSSAAARASGGPHGSKKRGCAHSGCQEGARREAPVAV